MSFFASCDWGTTHFRLRLVENGSLQVVSEVKTSEGVAAVAGRSNPKDRPGAFARYLGDMLISLLRAQPGISVSAVIVSGMAGSRLGWRELPYAKLPFILQPSAFVRETLAVSIPGAKTIDAILLSGLCSGDDVMRGEEIELLGLLPEFGLSPITVILPGTHSKHVTLENHTITEFHTVMTGELFAHLQKSPTLQSSFTVESIDPPSLAFAKGVAQALKKGFLHAVFQIRSRVLLGELSSPEAAGFLSGLLIGEELSRVPHHPIFLAATEPLRSLYLEAARLLDLPDFTAIDAVAVEASVVSAHARFVSLF